MRTRSGPVGQTWASSARWASTAAVSAASGRSKAASNPSPVVLTTVPPARSTDARSSVSCPSRATTIAARRSSQSRVLPSISVMRNVAVRAPGMAVTGGTPWSAWCGSSGSSRRRGRMQAQRSAHALELDRADLAECEVRSAQGVDQLLADELFARPREVGAPSGGVLRLAAAVALDAPAQLPGADPGSLGDVGELVSLHGAYCTRAARSTIAWSWGPVPG